MDIHSIFRSLKNTSMPMKAVLIIGIVLITAFIHDWVIGIYDDNIAPEAEDDDNDNNNTNVDYNLGVLVVAHGMPGQWNQRVSDCADEVTLPVPVELGFLEYSPYQTIDNAIEKLEEQGVNRIIAIPLFICGNSSHTHEVYEALEKADTNSEIVCTTCLDNHTFVAEILIEHGLQLCKGDPYDPRDENIKPDETTLIFYGHGDAEEWIQNWVAIADLLKNQIETDSTYHFKEVTYCFMGEGNLRSAVEKAIGHPLVVPWMIARSSFSETNIREEVGDYILVGECEYDGNHLVDHPNIPEWVEMQFYDYENNIVWTTSDRGR